MWCSWPAASFAIRRSEMMLTWAAPMRIESNASASTIGWKLPLDSARPLIGETSGLSARLFNSTVTACSASSTCRRNAPWTCGMVRIDSGSCSEIAAPGLCR